MGRDRYNQPGGQPHDVEEEGVSVLTAALKKMNFTGAGALASEGAPGEVDVLIPGATSGPAVPLIPSKEIYVDGNRVDIYIPNGSIQFPYVLIQDAIDAAVGVTTIHVTPYLYTEDLSITKGLLSIVSSDPSAPRDALAVRGSITINIAGGGNVWLTGFTNSHDDGSALISTGAGDHKIFLNNCSFLTTSPGLHHAFEDVNTGASLVTANHCIFRSLDTTGGGMAYHCSGGSGSRRFFRTNFLGDNVNPDNRAVHIGGSCFFDMFDEDIEGGIEIRDTAFVALNRIRLFSGAASVVDTTSTNVASPSTMYLCAVISGGAVAVTGTGVFGAALTTWAGVEGTFAPTLTFGAGVINFRVTGADNITYDPSLSLYPLVSTNVRSALDEIEAVLAGSLRNQRYFILGSHNVNDGSFDVLRITSNGQVDVGFTVPDDFGSLNSVELICIPTGVNLTADIDLISQYAAEGEDKNTNSETDVASTYAFPTADFITAMDLTSVLSSLAVGDYCGINVDANTIGITLNCIAIKLDYNKAP